MFANTVVIPISIGHALHLSPPTITASLERAFIVTGIACILQAVAGHRLPLMEGQTGLWWGVLLSLAANAAATGESLQDLGGTLETSILLSGLLIGLLGITGASSWLRRLFTPVVMCTFYFLLAAQLIQIFFKGMIGLAEGPQIQPPVALLSVALVLLVLLLSIFGRGLLSNFALLIGIVAGWIAFRLLFGNHTQPAVPAGSALFTLFPLGKLTASTGLLIPLVLTGLLNTTNTVASLEGTTPLYGRSVTAAHYRWSFLITGFTTLIAGFIGLLPFAPYTSSLGFLRATRFFDRGPFLVGAALFILLGGIPALSQLFATLPVSVGDAVLFVAYLQLFGSALGALTPLSFSYKTIYRVAAPVLVGLALMTIPAPAFGTIPPLFRSLLQNGQVIGILLALLLEHTINWNKQGDTRETTPQRMRD